MVLTLLAAACSLGQSPVDGGRTDGPTASVANSRQETASTSGEGACTGTTGTDGDLAAEVVSVARSAMKDSDLRAVLVSVSRDGEELATASLGQSTDGVPAEPGMRFFNGAVVFAYMGVVMLQLDDEGVLDIDEPIEQWVPDVPGGEEITPRMLMSSMSGLRDFETMDSWLDTLYDNPFRPFTTSELEAYVYDDSPLLYEPGTAIENLTANTPNCTQERGWQHPVCYSFYDFYSEQGGETLFGQPVSSLEYLNGRLVQFFEHGKLVWKPENPANSQITIAPLGLQYFYFNDEDEAKLSPIRNFEYNMGISDIHAKIFSRTPILASGSSQTVYIIAKDQNNTPLIGAVVQIKLTYPDGKIEVINHTATDESGLAQMTFNANSSEAGIVKIEAQINYNSLETTTVTSFRIWY